MRRFVLVVGFILLCPLIAEGAAAPAASPVPAGPREWREPSTARQQAALAAGSDYRRFLTAAPGRWKADFDPVLATPRAIYGSGLQLFPADANQNRVENGVLKFLDDHAALFGGSRGDFYIDGLVFNRDLWIVVAMQRHQGVPVQGSHLSLSIKHGRLILLQGAAYRVSGVATSPRLGKEEAIGAAGRSHGLGNRRAGKSKDADEARSVILPLRTPGAVEYRLAWEVKSRREGDQQRIDRNVISYVDALGGQVLAAYDGNHYAFSGTTNIEAERRAPGDPLVTRPAPFLNLMLAGSSTQSGADGSFSSNIGGTSTTVSAQLSGRYVRVLNAGGPNASFSGTMLAGIPFSLVANPSNSDPSERMAYHAVHTTNRFVAPVFPSLGYLELQVNANVNLNDQCNAFSDGTDIYMFRGGSVCNATGRIFDVVAHEWGHGLDVHAPGSFQDSGLSEFIGDLVAFTQTDDHRIAPGFFVGGSAALRDLQSSFGECFDPGVTEVHDQGQMLASVIWDIHEDLEAAGVSADDLRRLMLLPIASAQTRSQWYLGMLAVDDDDGDLSNGTPHECLIDRQFRLHSCGAVRWPGIPNSAPRRCSPGANEPPVADAGPDRLIECAGPAGTAVTLDASASFDADGDALTFLWSGPFGTREGQTATVTLPPGQHAITLTVSDGLDSATDALNVSVRDTAGPVVSSATVSPGVLWPANHKLVPVTVAVAASEVCGGTHSCRVSSVESNEPVDGTGDGDMGPDWLLEGNSLLLRAERSGTGTGRIYTVRIVCTDSSGNVSTTSVSVSVPHSRP